jgi:hypothetical protein
VAVRASARLRIKIDIDFSFGFLNETSKGRQDDFTLSTRFTSAHDSSNAMHPIDRMYSCHSTIHAPSSI